MSWPKIRLGEVLREEREPVGCFDGEGLPVLGVTNVEGVTQTGIDASDDKSKYLRLRPHRFVYNPYRVNVGSLGLTTSSQNGITSPAYVIFRAIDALESRYLYHFLKSSRGNQLINFHGNRGTVRAALRFPDLCQIEIPLPTISEQRWIVARIEQLAAKLEEARGVGYEARHLTETLIGAVCNSITISNIHDDEVLDRGILSIKNGISRRPTGFEEGPIILRLVDLSGGMLDLSSPRRGSLSDKESEDYCLNPGDLLFIRVNGSRSIVGRCVPFHGADEPVCFNDHIMRVRVNNAILDSEYTALITNSPLGRNYIESVAITTAGQNTINHTMLRNFPIKIPSLEEQRHIVVFLNNLQAKVDSLKRLQDETAAELKALLPSVLDKAFKGEL